MTKKSTTNRRKPKAKPDPKVNPYAAATTEAEHRGPENRASYRTVAVHNVPARDVPEVIEAHRPFDDYLIMPEEDGEFTLIFVYRD